MKRSLSNLASVAEIVAAVAIVISLVFVGIQIKANTEATQAAMFQEHMGLEIEFGRMIGADASLATLWQTTQEDFESLAVTDRIQGSYLYLSMIRLWEGFFFQWRAGTLSEETWQSREPLIRTFISHSFMCVIYESGNTTFNGAFVEWVISVHEEVGFDVCE